MLSSQDSMDELVLKLGFLASVARVSSFLWGELETRRVSKGSAKELPVRPLSLPPSRFGFPKSCKRNFETRQRRNLVKELSRELSHSLTYVSGYQNPARELLNAFPDAYKIELVNELTETVGHPKHQRDR
ncbi:MAG: hypothetical protein AAFX06_07495 [Planctomycetota bacterium]